MQFIVETGLIVPDATSYVSVAEADDLVPLLGTKDDRTVWATLDTTTKETKLMAAVLWMARAIDWNGARVSQDQPLDWPRMHCPDADGYYISETVIPPEVKQTQVVVALWLLSQDSAPDTPEGDGIKRFRADVIEVEFQDGYSGAPRVPPFLAFVLRGLGSLLVGPGFKKIKRT